MSDSIECDLLVLGAGMAGLSAAAKAAESGARVIVVEKQGHYGGSAALSGGVVWTVQSLRKYRYISDGDPDLAAVLLDTYEEAVAWLRGRGVTVQPAMPVLMGRGYRTDILTHLRDCAATVEAAGGYIALESQAVSLLPREGGGVAGAVVRHADGELTIRSPWVLLATGGFQASPELRARHIHPNARDIPLRSNPASDGGGLTLGRAAGGHFPDDNPGFYGHLVSETPEWGDPRLFSPLSQYHSDRGVLINEQGERFCDESHGDHVNTQRVVEQTNARALLVWDERLQQDHVLFPHVKDAPAVDRMALARLRGGNGAVVRTFEELADFASAQGFDGPQVRRTLEDYNARVREGWEGLRPRRVEYFEAFETAPFYALVVVPAITFTHGGLSVDTQARVLDAAGAPVPGLLAAGADAGDVFKVGYAGGLALALTFGLRAARTAGFA